MLAELQALPLVVGVQLLVAVGELRGLEGAEELQGEEHLAVLDQERYVVGTPGAAQRAWALVEIAQAQAKTGDAAGARRTINAAVAAAERLPELLDESHVMITHINGQRGRIYRSRLVGLTEATARTACRRLEKAKVDCLVLRIRRKLALVDQPGARAAN